MSRVFGNLILMVSCISILFACNGVSEKDGEREKKKSEESIIRYFYPNGKIKAERPYVVIAKDTLTHGAFKLYYPSGSLQLELFYEEGNKEGMEKGYFENNLLEHVGWYKKGKQDSLWVWYYNKPAATRDPIRAVDYWKNGSPLSHQIKYDVDGNYEEYLFYDPLGRLIFKRKYNGKNFSDEGSKYPQIVMVNEKNNNFRKGDSLLARIYHIAPPKQESKTLLNIPGLTKGWQEIFSSNYYEPILYSLPLNQEGDFRMTVKLELNDTMQTGPSSFVNEIEFSVK